MKTIISSVFILTLFVLTSCGKNGGSSSSSNNEGTADNSIVKQESEGSYRALLRPFNNHLNGFLPTGVAEIEVRGDQISVKTLLDDDGRVMHMQSVHIGNRCPITGRDDKNGDTYVDIKEMEAITGKVLFPLDGNLNSAEEGAGQYPVGRGFTYIKTASLSKLEGDVKSRTGQNLNLEGRVVVIHGVDPRTQIPDTFAVIDNLTKQASAPIACGILKREF